MFEKLKQKNVTKSKKKTVNIRFDFVEVLDHIVADLHLLLRLHKFERSLLILDH